MQTKNSRVPRVLGSDAAIAIGRFSPRGPLGYQAKSGGPIRKTRAEAERDEFLRLERRAAEGR